MEDQRSGKGTFFGPLSRFASYVDDTLRSADLRWNRTAGGILEHICSPEDIDPSLHSRHSIQYLLLPTMVSGIVVMGIPEIGLRLLLSLVAMTVVFTLVIVATRLSLKRGWTLRKDLMVQAAIVLGVAAAVWLSSNNIYHRGIPLYRHFFVLAASVVAFALVTVGLLSRLPWSTIKPHSNYRETVKKTELFVSREKGIPLGWSNLLQSFLTVFPGAPLQLLFPPAVVALLARPHMLKVQTLTALGISYFVLLMGGFDARLNQTWLLVQNIFFRGWALLLSLIVIALGAARFFGVTYVTTIFDTAEGVVITLLLFFAYVLFWWYDYWVNRLLAQELIQLLSPEEVQGAGIPYVIEPGSVKTSVHRDNRVLQVHGSSRLIVIGSSEDYPVCFHTYSFEKLFDHLGAAGAPGGKIAIKTFDSQKRNKLTPSPGQVSERITDYKVYASVALVLFVLLAGWIINRRAQLPQLDVPNKVQPSLHLSQLLFHQEHSRNGRPALIIAASGGGTRAALYTATVMEGLARQGTIKDVIMGSGVSGGGAALAYYAGSRPTLVDRNEFFDGWKYFFDAMKKPFIVDVLNSAIEWRTVSSSRLGQLLSESFEDHWRLPERRNRMGDVQDFGLILNTAIAGKFTCSFEDENATESPCKPRPNGLHEFICCFTACATAPKTSSLTVEECRFRKATRSDPAGGRLILTNVSLGDCFVKSTGETGGAKGLPVVVHDPDTRLEVAAALNANFPPVFSNAAVDLEGRFRYWVTDGGAVDNRGVEMPLFAVRDALMNRDRCTVASSNPLPKITLVIVDASAYSGAYSQDRGIGSAMGAGTQAISLLAEEQVRLITMAYEKQGQKDAFQVIYLPMPLCLRESGSFGTHWMLQPTIEITIGSKGNRRLSGEEVIKLLRVMHGNGRREDLSPDGREILDYAVRDRGWSEGARKLGFLKE